MDISTKIMESNALMAAENSVFHQWKQGDIIQLPPNMHHVTCNAGLEPKLTMTVTGIVSDESLKRKELGKFEYP